MKAIILAAGVGRRLGGTSGNKPKCLLEFDGTSLLQRHLNLLRKYGISDVIVVTGHLSKMIEDETTHSDAKDITRTIYNPEFSKGSLISLLTGLEELQNAQDFILMDADVLYDHRIIERLINTNHSNCFLLDRNFIPGDEPMKLCVRDGSLIDFRKQIDKDLQFNLMGESVGFFRFSVTIVEDLIARAKSYLTQGKDDAPYEELIRDLLLEHPDNFGYEDITGIPWIEIDFPEDVTRAQTEVLPLIMQTAI